MPSPKPLEDLAKILNKLDNPKEITQLLEELLTTKEIKRLSLRLELLKKLSHGKTQREIAKSLQVSLCKITRGSKILKNKQSIIKNHL